MSEVATGSQWPLRVVRMHADIATESVRILVGAP